MLHYLQEMSRSLDRERNNTWKKMVISANVAFDSWGGGLGLSDAVNDYHGCVLCTATRVQRLPRASVNSR